MQGMTDREKAIALAGDGPATGINLALAELSLYWDNHRRGAPLVHELRINIRITDEGTPGDRIGAVQAVADWLGVEKHERYGVHIAQRKFGTGDDSILVEAHYTPDQDATHTLVREAHDREDASELAAA